MNSTDFRIVGAELAAGLERVQAGVNSTDIFDSMVKISAQDDDTLTITAANRNTGVAVRTRAAAKVNGADEILVDHKTLHRLLQGYHNEAVHVRYTTPEETADFNGNPVPENSTPDIPAKYRHGAIAVNAGNSKTLLPCRETDGFIVPEGLGDSADSDISITASSLRALLESVQYSANTDPAANSALASVQVSVRGIEANAAATDRFRMAYAETVLQENPQELSLESTIPNAAVSALCAILSRNDPNAKCLVGFDQTEQRLRVSLPATDARFSLVSQPYQDLESYIPQQYIHELAVDHAELSRASEIAAAYAEDEKPVILIEIMTSGQVRITAQGSVGKADIPVHTYQDNPSQAPSDEADEKIFTISLNPKFVAQTLQHIKSAKVAINANNFDEPLVMTGVDETTVNSSHVIMPLNTGQSNNAPQQTEAASAEADETTPEADTDTPEPEYEADESVSETEAS